MRPCSPFGAHSLITVSDETCSSSCQTGKGPLQASRTALWRSLSTSGLGLSRDRLLRLLWKTPETYGEVAVQRTTNPRCHAGCFDKVARLRLPRSIKGASC